MRKKTLALILVCILGLAITACGTSSTIEDSNTEKIDSSEMDNNISVTVNESGEDAEKSKAQGVSIIGDNYEITRDIYGLVIERRMSSEYNYSDFETDHKGNIISAKVTGSNTHNMLYEYDDNNRLIKSTKQTVIYGIDEQNWIYDEAGYLTELKLIKTDKNGKSEEKIDTYNYDDSGNYVSGQRTTNGGSIFEVIAEHDELGRVTKVTETFNGEVQYTYTYTYEEGVYNPVHRTEESSRNKYEIDVFYDDQGRVVHEDSVDKDGKNTTNEFVYP